MDIASIKSALIIDDVLSHYGLKADRNNMLCCPFHKDLTPSMQVYPETNTVFCFSANCDLNGKAIDQIDFILHKEKLTKHEAIEKAKTLAVATTGKVSAPKTKALETLLKEGHQSLSRSQKAQNYCSERNLNVACLEIAFLSDAYYLNYSSPQKTALIEAGVLRELPNKKLSTGFRSTIVFALKNKHGLPVSLYGRSIDKASKVKHVYPKGKHEGLYPSYPNPKTKHLILTESVIDAATIHQYKQHEVLALYGTNGLTEEHIDAVSQLKELEEITLMFDGDAAGEKAIQKYTEQLAEQFTHLKISRTELPEGEDVNSLLIAHQPEIIDHLLEERKELKEGRVLGVVASGRGIEPLNVEPEKRLITESTDHIVYQQAPIQIQVWGGVPYANLHQLKLSLYLKNQINNRTFRDDVNLYSYKSFKGFLEDAGQELDYAQSELKSIMDTFTREVEDYRLKRREDRKTNTAVKVELTPYQQEAAIKQLKNTNLITYIKTSMSKCGLIGETNNGLLLFLIFLTRHFENPLHALVHGSSGSGKTNLLKTILNLVPEESKYTTTALTENVLFRPPFKTFWKHKILLLEDLDGSYKALLPLREFMTAQKISKFVSEPDPKTGKYEQVLLEAEGPICIAGATTKDKVYEDNSNRSFLLHVNESKKQQEAVLDYQNKQAAGLINKESMVEVEEDLHNLQRVLDPTVTIINPFQPELKLPEYVFKKLRTNTHYITLIKAITFLNQYQRQQRNGIIETTLEDVALANTLSKASLLRKSDELSGQLRDFFERLKQCVKQSEKDTFLAKDIRGQLRMHPMKFSRYVGELKNRGYVRKVSGKEKGSYEYRIEIWDDYQLIKKGLEVMDRVLEKLYKHYPDGKYSRGVPAEGGK